MSKTLKLAVGDFVVMIYPLVDFQYEPVEVIDVGQYYGGQEYAMLKDRTMIINELIKGTYHSASGREQYLINPKYCHLHTQPELQCTEQCNHCNEFDKSIK